MLASQMKRVPPTLAKAYVPALRRTRVPFADAQEYLKWLRFYLDFCAKYEFPPRDGDSLEPFLQKLTQKRQTIAQQKQATRAISIYYRLMEKWVESNGTAAPPGNREWESALQAMKDAIRVRQYSPKTLKTYRLSLSPCAEERIETW
jgi:hypothetical protein